MAEYNQRPMPQTPNTAARNQRRQYTYFTDKLWQQIASPSPLFTQSRDNIDKRRHQHSSNNLTCENCGHLGCKRLRTQTRGTARQGKLRLKRRRTEIKIARIKQEP